MPQRLAAVTPIPVDPETLPLGSVETVMRAFLGAVAQAPSLVEVNIAAGVALEALRQMTS